MCLSMDGSDDVTRMRVAENRIASAQAQAYHRATFLGNVRTQHPQQADEVIPADILPVWMGKQGGQRLVVFTIHVVMVPYYGTIIKEIRGQTEAMIAAMTCPSSRWAYQWPFKDAMQVPIDEGLLKVEQKIHGPLCKCKLK